MSNSSWKKLLSEKLKPPALRIRSRLAIIGMGAELNGDDAVGIHVARRLQAGLESQKDILIIEGGTLPESFTSTLRSFHPELVILIDAANFGGATGEIEWIEAQQTSGGGFSTHSMPLSLLTEYLKQEMECQVMILGIQPANIEFGSPLTEKCENAANEISNAFFSLINS